MDSLEENIEEPVESDPIGNSVDSERSFESIDLFTNFQFFKQFCSKLQWSIEGQSIWPKLFKGFHYLAFSFGHQSFILSIQPLVFS